eukprot:1607690-Karenia_brevis.AAC.1
MLEGSDEQFRSKLAQAQSLCPEVRRLVAAQNQLLNATQGESIKDAEAVAKNYRLNPVDGVLENSVLVTKAAIWVPVMPSTPVPGDYFT